MSNEGKEIFLIRVKNLLFYVSVLIFKFSGFIYITLKGHDGHKGSLKVRRDGGSMVKEHVRRSLLNTFTHVYIYKKVGEEKCYEKKWNERQKYRITRKVSL